MPNSIIEVDKLDFQWKTEDPFLFCAYHRDDYPKGNEHYGPDASLQGRPLGQDFQLRDGWRMYHGEQVPGFPSHPHRGFETITIVEKGLVDHADSLGGAARYGQGDVQWLTTGRGIQHSEMFPLVNKDQENPLLLFQIWLNLPAETKMADPHFAMYWNEDIPVIKSGNGQVRVKLIAGELGSHKSPHPPPDSWASNPESLILICLIELSPGAHWKLPAAEAGLYRKLFFYEGEQLTVAGQTVEKGHGIKLRPDLDVELENHDQQSYILLLQGRPLNEPVAHYGPFVMNTREQLQQAFDDYRLDQFGGWPWNKSDEVHDNKSRFAVFPDGSEQYPVGNQ